MEEALAPKGGTVQETFSLMMHDRLVALERAVWAMQRLPSDPRVTVLGHATVSRTGAVFLRLKTSGAVSIAALADSVLRRLGSRVAVTRWDMWACQHWSLGMGTTPHVAELLVQRSGEVPVDVYHVAHAVVDALDVSQESAAVVEVCAVTSPAWFVESVRTAASAAGEPATMHTWDPVAETVLRSVDEMSELPAHERHVWTMLHGWLASQVEVTDVWHPRGLSAASSGVQLVSLLSALVQ